jgi:TATA-binding protein-associated factor Taf7
VSKDLQVMSLKKLVNDKQLYDEFLKHVDDLIYLQHKQMEQATEPVIFYRAQGAINQLRKLKHLREQVNNG